MTVVSFADLTWADRLLRMLGYDFSDIPADATDVSFIWTNMPQSWGVFVLIGVIAAVGYAVLALYRREIDTCPRSVKTLLAATRIVVLLLLVVIYLSPALTYSQRNTREPFIVVMRDASQSMNTPDSYDDQTAHVVASATHWPIGELQAEPPSRAKILNELLARDNGRLLRQLQQRGKVRIADFSDRVRMLETRPAATDSNGTNDVALASDARNDDDGENSSAKSPPAYLPPLVADGRSTDLHSAIVEGLNANPLAAVVIFTDGQHTASDDPGEAAVRAKEKGVPLFLVGIGDPSRPRNLKVANVYVRPHAWQNDPFEIEAVILAQGVESSGGTIELTEQTVVNDQKGPDRVVLRESFSIPPGGGQLRHSFSHTVKQPGNYVYSVRVEPLSDEQNQDDNRHESPLVKVLDRDAVRVLLVSGAPTWEYRMLQRLLTRDPTITVSCWLQTMDSERQQEGDRPITHLPRTAADLNWYDVVMLLDPNPDEFDTAWIELLKAFTGDHSGGILYMAGPKYSARFLSGGRTGAIKDFLPVRFGDVGATEVAALLSTNNQAWPLRVVPASADHPVMSFYQDRQTSLSRWENLPGIYWSFPALEVKPTAQVLVEHSDPALRRIEGSRPLLVTGRYGSANTMYAGFNGTWLWRRVGHNAEFFDRFWIQTTRYLVEGRSLEGRRRGYVQTDRDRYEIGDKITVTARLQDAAYQPLVVSQVEATLQAADAPAAAVTLKQVADQPGQYEATLAARRTGMHTLSVPLPVSAAAEPSRIETSFTVELPSVEANQVWLNKPLLIDLAQKSGGQYFEINQLDKLAAAIPDAAETIEVRAKPKLLWDVPAGLILLVGLLSFEWAVRKGYKLL